MGSLRAYFVRFTLCLDPTATEVDWYVSNVGAYHVKHAMDPNIAIVQDIAVHRWLLTEDKAVVRAAALAVGIEELKALVTHWTSIGELVKAARLEFVTGMAIALLVGGGSTGEAIAHEKAALALIERSGETSDELQKMELVMSALHGTDWCVLISNAVPTIRICSAKRRMQHAEMRRSACLLGSKSY